MVGWIGLLRCCIVVRDERTWRWWCVVTRDAGVVVLCRCAFMRNAGVLARAVGGGLLTRQVVYAAEDLRNHC